MIRRSPVLLAIVAIAVGAAACSPAATTAPTSAPATTAPATAAPSTAAPTTAKPATPAPTAAAGGATVNAQSVGTAGTILVDGKTGKTLYMFTQDVKGSGKSNCTGGCLTTWPALTVAAGATPTGGSGVTGTLATITRDDGTLQVTYNGQPLYFFKNDQAPGDLNGVYASWETVAP